MSTAYAKRIKAQGSERFLKIGSRLFTFDHMADGKGRELSEILNAGPGWVESLPGFWRGQKHYGFPLLASAALDRRYAMQTTDSWRRLKFIERAYENIERAKDFGKPKIDPVERVRMREAA